ncbi:MAG: outer membrane protein assembly factor BamD [Vicingaceae bacterium]
MLFACSEYQKVLKSSDLDYKYEKALEYYENDEYFKALPLFEELIPLYRGSSRAEKVYYYYCYCNYYEEFYDVAAYHFKKYSKTFSTSSHAEEALFMSGYCNYIQSPAPSLDQTNTKRAISELQLFINSYPTSNLVDSSNSLIDKLRSKLEEKSYNNAYLYYKTENYKSAIIALNNHLKDYPETDKAELVNFIILKSNYFLAINSIQEKKLERFNNTIEAYYNFVDLFPNSKYIKEAEAYFNKAIIEKTNLENKNL